MAITLTGAGGLFTILKKVDTALGSIRTVQGTTAPGDINAILGEMGDANTAAGTERTKGLSTALTSFQASTVLQRAVAVMAKRLVVDRVVADVPAIPTNDAAAVAELIRQMGTQAEDVKANVVSASVASNPGTAAPTLLVTDTDGKGVKLQTLFPETIVGQYATATTLKLTSGAQQRDTFRHDWPAGSGLNKSLGFASSLLTNPGFDTDAAQANAPDGWTVEVGTVGTTVLLTKSEVQTLTVTGGPTSGLWPITYTDALGNKQTTAPLAFDATASDVEGALQALSGLSAVTVTAAGTLPADVVYTVNFNGTTPPGDQPALTASNTFDQGSVNVAETQAGEPAHAFRSLVFNGNNVQLTHLRQPLQGLGLLPSTVYGLRVQMRIETGATGVLEAELTDGAGAVLVDGAGSNNRLTTNLATLSTDFEPKTILFRTPATLPTVFYFSLRLSTAINTNKKLYIDEANLAAATPLYTGGPLAIIFDNDRQLQAGDRYELTVANDLGGNQQTNFWRLYGPGHQLPSSAGGTIPD